MSDGRVAILMGSDSDWPTMGAAATALEEFGAGKPGFKNPYSGEVFDRGVSWLEAHGRSRADIRM